MTAILDAILKFLKALEGLVETFNILFCPYFRSYLENFSLLGAISSIQLG